MVAQALHHPVGLLLKAQGMTVAFLDVDGVLTDGGLHYASRGELIKRFHVLDGYGIQLLRASGIEPVVISGRDSRPLRARVRELGIAQAHFGVGDKCQQATQVLHTLGQPWSRAAAMGDDWPDLALMRRCALAVAPPDAHVEVLSIADHVTSRRGGQGAVRDFCDLLLLASGKYAQLLADAGA